MKKLIITSSVIGLFLAGTANSYTVNGDTLASLASQLQSPAASARVQFFIEGYTLNFSDYTGTSSTHNCCTTVTIEDGELSYEGVILTLPSWGDKPSAGDPDYCAARVREWNRFRTDAFTHESGHVQEGQDQYDEDAPGVESSLDSYSRDACATTTSVAQTDAEEFAENFILGELAAVNAEKVTRQTAFDNDPANTILDLRTRFDNDC